MSERILEKYLSGILPSGAVTASPHTSSGEDARVDKFKRRMEEASRLGQVCERKVLKSWMGIAKPPPAELEGALIDVLSELNFIGERTYSPKELAPLYEKLAAPVWPDDGGLAEPRNDALWELLTYVDEIYDTDLMFIYAALPQFGGGIKPQARYLIETALVLGKEALHPLSWKGILVPDLRVYDKGQQITQVDAVMIPRVEGVSIADWHVPPARKGFFLMRGRFPPAALTHPYDAIEIKTPFSAALTTGQGKLRKPIKKHLRSFQHRLGEIALWWKEQREGFFPFPDRLHLVYLRGSLPHVVHQIPLDSSFFGQWIEGLKKKRVLIEIFLSQAKAGAYISGKIAAEIPMIGFKYTEIEALITILTNAQAIATEREEKRKQERTIRMGERLDRLKEKQGGKGEQGVLFERPSAVEQEKPLGPKRQKKKNKVAVQASLFKKEKNSS